MNNSIRPPLHHGLLGPRWAVSGPLLAAVWSVFLGLGGSGCHRSKSKSKQVPKARKGGRAPGSAPRQTRANGPRKGPAKALDWHPLVSRLPLEADLYLGLSLSRLQQDMPMLPGFVALSPQFQWLKKECGLGVEALFGELVAGMSFDGAQGLVQARGAKFPAAKWVECVRKVLAKRGVSVQPVGSLGSGGPVWVALPKGLLKGILPRIPGVPVPKVDRILLMAKGTSLTAAWGGWASKLAKGTTFARVGANRAVSQLLEGLGGRTFWLLSLGLSPLFADRLPNINAVRQIRAMGFGLNASVQGLEAVLLLDMRSSDSARRLADALRRYLPGLDKFDVRLAPFKPLFEKLKIRAQGERLTLSVALTMAELMQLRMYLRMPGMPARAGL